MKANQSPNRLPLRLFQLLCSKNWQINHCYKLDLELKIPPTLPPALHTTLTTTFTSTLHTSLNYTLHTSLVGTYTLTHTSLVLN